MVSIHLQVKMGRNIIISLFILLSSCGVNKSKPNQSILSAIKDTTKFAFWNVENLFDTINGATFDDDFTPEGYNHWDSARYAKKIFNLSFAINQINADVLGLCEVENRQVLEDLKSTCESLKNHGIIHYESPDERGIDVALYYNVLQFEAVSSQPIQVNLADNDKTRDILKVVLRSKYTKDTLAVFVNHWPSRRGGLIASNPNRFKAARILRAALDKTKHPFIIMGDLNDGPSDSSVASILGSCNPIAEKKSCSSYDLAATVNSDKEGSHCYRGNWNMLDHIILSPNLINGSSKTQYEQNSFGLFKPDYLIQQFGKYKGYPARALAGGRFLDGYSDHLPVQCTLIQK